MIFRNPKVGRDEVVIFDTLFWREGMVGTLNIVLAGRAGGRNEMLNIEGRSHVEGKVEVERLIRNRKEPVGAS